MVREPRDEPRLELGVHVGEPGEELSDTPGEGASEVKPGDLLSKKKPRGDLKCRSRCVRSIVVITVFVYQ